MNPIDMDQLETPYGGSVDFYKGQRYSGVAYGKDAKTGVIVEIAGFDGGFLVAPIAFGHRLACCCKKPSSDMAVSMGPVANGTQTVR